MIFLDSSFLVSVEVEYDQNHERAIKIRDDIIRGKYGNNEAGKYFQGCAIGCSLHSLNLLQGKGGTPDEVLNISQHDRYAAELNLPAWLARIEDHLFEHLPDAESLTWPRRFLAAIPVGVEIPNRIVPFLMRWDLAGGRYTGVTYPPSASAAEGASIVEVLALFDRELAGDPPTLTEWQEAEARARAGAWAGAWVRAQDVSRAGAWARAGAGAGAWAWAQDVSRLSHELLRVLKALPTVPKGVAMTI